MGNNKKKRANKKPAAAVTAKEPEIQIDEEQPKVQPEPVVSSRIVKRNLRSFSERETKKNERS